MATSISTHTTNSAEYETKNNPSTLIESITKQAENARKYERIFECGVRCLTGYTNGNSEADTVKAKVHNVEDNLRSQRLARERRGRRGKLTEYNPPKDLVHEG